MVRPSTQLRMLTMTPLLLPLFLLLHLFPTRGLLGQTSLGRKGKSLGVVLLLQSLAT